MAVGPPAPGGGELRQRERSATQTASGPPGGGEVTNKAEGEICHPDSSNPYSAAAGFLTEARPSPTTQLRPGCRPKRDSRMRAMSSSIGDEDDGEQVASATLLPPLLPLGGACMMHPRGHCFMHALQ